MAGTVSHWQAEPAPPPGAARNAGGCDVAVVGGGIAGVSVAHWLRRLEPGLDVVVLEKDRLATGASGRNAGFLLQGTDADYATTVARLGRERARRLWKFTCETRDGLADALADADVGFEAAGSFTVAGDEAEAQRLRTSQRLLREDGVEAEYLVADTTNERLGSEGFLGALYVPAGAVLNPVRAVRALAERSGARLWEETGVLAIEPAGNGLHVTTTGGMIEAGRVVVAVNAALPRLLPDLAGIVAPVRAQMLATEPVPRRLAWPLYSHEGYFYLRQMPTGEVLLGGARHLHREAEVGDEDATTQPLQADLEAYLRRHFPALAAPVTRRWSGTMGFSRDGLPAFGEAPDRPGAWWVGGFTGHGMGYGFRMGRTVAAAVLGHADPYADLFRADRFTAR